jgi:hypothetical protein
MCGKLPYVNEDLWSAGACSRFRRVSLSSLPLRSHLLPPVPMQSGGKPPHSKRDSVIESGRLAPALAAALQGVGACRRGRPAPAFAACHPARYRSDHICPHCCRCKAAASRRTPKGLRLSSAGACPSAHKLAPASAAALQGVGASAPTKKPPRAAPSFRGAVPASSRLMTSCPSPDATQRSPTYPGD